MAYRISQTCCLIVCRSWILFSLRITMWCQRIRVGSEPRVSYQTSRVGDVTPLLSCCGAGLNNWVSAIILMPNGSL